MHLKKLLIAGTATALLAGSLLNVSAAPISSSDFAKTLQETENESLIIDVEAYKAAYDDLAKAFGDDDAAYIEHYLTKGVYEGRTKGVLFDPLAYAEAYGDVRDAYGDDIFAIVNHYINFGVAENRTMGTANGCADIAAAEKSSGVKISVPRTAARSGSYNASTAASGYVPGSSIDRGSYEPIAGTTESAGGGSIPTNGSYTAPTTGPAQNYHHTTSIYANDDSTLLRVEYYDDNNKLFEYSSVTNFDKTTNSYTETVYRYDDEKQEQVATRTDTYVNGQLASSQKH